MGSVTGVFTSENRLHPAARQVLMDAIDKGWANPSKIHHSSRELAHLLEQSRAIFASHLNVPSASLHFLGEPALGFHLGVNGLLHSGDLYLPATSRQELLAIAQRSKKATVLPVDLAGSWSIPQGSRDDLLVWSTANIETGAHASPPSQFEGRIFVDATADYSLAIPSRWSTALWDSKSWCGPQGLGVFALSETALWKNPLPYIDQRVVPGDFNPALVIASAVALQAFEAERIAAVSAIAEINSYIRDFVTAEIGDVDIASPASGSAHLLSFSFLYLHAEQLVEKMDARGYSLDSGSACISANLEPSHVLAAMGRLTHGNVRLHLYPDHSIESVRAMLHALKDVVAELRTGQ
jgi:cysteine desulfurase